jgi:hypothetical protein
MSSPQMMNSGRRLPAGAVMTNRIIWFGLFFGQVAAGGVFGFMIQQGSVKPQKIPMNIMLLIDAAMLIFAIGVTLVVPRLMINPKADEKTLLQQYGISNIIPMACLEGASFFGLIIVLLSTHWWPGGVVPAIAIVVQLLQFPRSVLKDHEPN